MPCQPRSRLWRCPDDVVLPSMLHAYITERCSQLASLLVLGASLLVHVNCSGEARWPPPVEPVPSPASAGSGQPQMAVTGNRAVLSWIERAGARTTLKFAERTASGWSAPRVVASGEDWFIHSADVPSVVRLDDGSFAAHWLQNKGTNPEAYDVRLAFSTNDGATWTAPVTPHHDDTESQHGFASLFQMPGAGLGVVWLDGRAMPSGGQEHEGQPGQRECSRGRIRPRENPGRRNAHRWPRVRLLPDRSQHHR